MSSEVHLEYPFRELIRFHPFLKFDILFNAFYQRLILQNLDLMLV
jgi:hypothetical protein